MHAERTDKRGFFINFVVVRNMLKLIKRQDNNELTKLTDKTG
jgi:hypothetical protein